MITKERNRRRTKALLKENNIRKTLTHKSKATCKAEEVSADDGKQKQEDIDTQEYKHFHEHENNNEGTNNDNTNKRGHKDDEE
eukprot:13612993-Heterocapsa_arctica.AAC.1